MGLYMFNRVLMLFDIHATLLLFAIAVLASKNTRSCPLLLSMSELVHTS